MTTPFTASPPETSGQYNPDGNATNFFCNYLDVYDELVGIDLTKLQDYIANGMLPNYTGVTDIASLITNRIIPKAESEAEAWLNQSFRPKQESRFFNGNGSHEMNLPYFPVLSIDYAQINLIPAMRWYTFNNVFLTTSLGNVNPDTSGYRSVDLLCDTETGHLQIPARTLYAQAPAAPLWNYTFLVGQGNIQITWTYGFADPGDVPESFTKGVALLAAMRLIQAAGALDGQGATGIHASNLDRTYGREKNLPYSDLLDVMSQNSKDLLRPYKRFSA